ncbi:MAG: 23S rRNA (pseudouridine(1915)-N(3))-methyltransferase RlmH [Clostridiales bacterium]|nr:23S rRNA (pseudouridine(1915)-N(3))-methyltransferase RlmH [Clostridiales bacterium]
MLSLRIIALGKIKEPYLRQGIAEYVKRLTTLANLHIVELPDEKLPERPASESLERVKELEGRRLMQAVRQGEYVIALDIAGEQLSSLQLADKMAQLALAGQSSISFIIGASAGLSKEVLRRADLRLSFGLFTYPHQLMRLILLEQLYRSCKINRGEPYHK